MSSLVRLHCYPLWFFLEYFFLCISMVLPYFRTLSVLWSWSWITNEIQALGSRIWPILLVESDLWICERRFQKPTNSTFLLPVIIRSLPHVRLGVIIHIFLASTLPTTTSYRARRHEGYRICPFFRDDLFTFISGLMAAPMILFQFFRDPPPIIFFYICGDDWMLVFLPREPDYELHSNHLTHYRPLLLILSREPEKGFFWFIIYSEGLRHLLATRKVERLFNKERCEELSESDLIWEDWIGRNSF